MWRTETGDRVLRGAEAACFQWGIERLVCEFTDRLSSPGGDVLPEFEDHHVGVRVFDRLSGPERLAILEHVARALLVKSVPCPELTAVAEATIAAVYHQLFGEIDLEIDDARTDLRALLLAAAGECDYDEEGGDPLPALNSDDPEPWRDLIEYLMFRILWDEDWQHEYVKPDDPPHVAEQIRAMARIDASYYTAVPPDPNPAQLERIMKSLARLWNKKVR